MLSVILQTGRQTQTQTQHSIAYLFSSLLLLSFFSFFSIQACTLYSVGDIGLCFKDIFYIYAFIWDMYLNYKLL